MFLPDDVIVVAVIDVVVVVGPKHDKRNHPELYLRPCSVRMKHVRGDLTLTSGSNPEFTVFLFRSDPLFFTVRVRVWVLCSYFEYMSKAFFHKLPTVLCKIVGVYQIGYHNKITGKRQMDQVAATAVFVILLSVRTNSVKGRFDPCAGCCMVALSAPELRNIL